MGSNGKYSKTKLVGKRWMSLAIILVIILIISSIALKIYINSTNIIVYENIDKDSSKVNQNTASQSTPIVINNLVIGGVYDDKWVSMERYYLDSVNKESYDIDIFTRKGKTGSFKLKGVEQNEEATVTYTTTTSTNYRDEYFAVKAGTTSVAKMDEIPLDEDNIPLYKDYVKKALGLYGFLNNTIKIREVYEVALIPGEISYVISATNEGKTSSGVYSSVIFVDNISKVKLIKYNYIKDINNAEDFGIYTTKFISDLNGDKKCEIILQETREFNTKYSVMEYFDDKFYEVLSTTVNN